MTENNKNEKNKNMPIIVSAKLKQQLHPNHYKLNYHVEKQFT